jgi:hypothetical protein
VAGSGLRGTSLRGRGDPGRKHRSPCPAAQVPVGQNRLIQLSGGTPSVNRNLEAKARTLAGIKGDTTSGGGQEPDVNAITAIFEEPVPATGGWPSFWRYVGGGDPAIDKKCRPVHV